MSDGWPDRGSISMRPTGRVITTVAQVEQDARIHEKRGADRERGRIRRALRGVVSEAKLDHYWSKCGCATCELIRALDAATRAARKKVGGKP